MHMLDELRVLVIEGDAAHAADMEADVAGEGVNARLSTSLDDALRLLRGGRIDAVVADLDLPDSRGLNTLQALRHVCPDIPLVVVVDPRDAHLAGAIRAQGVGFLRRDRIPGHLRRSLLVRMRQTPPRTGESRPIRPLCLPDANSFAEVQSVARAASMHAPGVVVVSLSRPGVTYLQALGELDDLVVIDGISGDGEAPHPSRRLQRTGGPTRLEKMAMLIERACTRSGPGTHVVLDCLDVMLLYNGPAQCRAFIHYLSNRARTLGVSMDIVVLDTPEAMRALDGMRGFLDA